MVANTPITKDRLVKESNKLIFLLIVFHDMGAFTVKTQRAWENWVGCLDQPLIAMQLNKKDPTF